MRNSRDIPGILWDNKNGPRGARNTLGGLTNESLVRSE